MAKKVFHTLDEATFKGVDSLKASPQFNQASAALEGLPDEAQKYINQGLTYLLSFAPLIIFLVVFIIAAMTRGQVADKEALIAEVDRYNAIVAETENVGGSLLGKTTLTNQSDLQRMIASLASSYQMKRDAIKVTNFSNQKYGNLVESEASLVFNGLSTPKFLAILDELAVKEKATFKRVNIKKVKDALQGELSFIHYSRTSP
mgnify:CR=1 FL=1